ncbi:hypothetical protein HD553DRAFT_7779 [Filobasidium floriforme]|uniref:uncharacterized protein n=1 Tax=Filobasidium floriforme TaxID=5210 RepID=UPI001E8CDC24|nr:uncharacterized protein HD553DRAFT_7779 [Filobasidium floriforme]KAH8090522.1 hypothetical protein HD553DRAFT_7779 [Filobasidium floriforme]
MSSRTMSFILFAFVALLAIFAPIAQAASVRLTSGPLVACRFAKLRFEDVQAPVTVTITDSVSGTSEEMSLRSGSGVGWFVELAPGSNVTISIKDDLDQTAALVNQFVVKGDDDSCYSSEEALVMQS